MASYFEAIRELHSLDRRASKGALDPALDQRRQALRGWADSGAQSAPPPATEDAASASPSSTVEPITVPEPPTPAVVAGPPSKPPSIVWDAEPAPELPPLQLETQPAPVEEAPKHETASAVEAAAAEPPHSAAPAEDFDLSFEEGADASSAATPPHVEPLAMQSLGTTEPAVSAPPSAPVISFDAVETPEHASPVPATIPEPITFDEPVIPADAAAVPEFVAVSETIVASEPMISEAGLPTETAPAEEPLTPHDLIAPSESGEPSAVDALLRSWVVPDELVHTPSAEHIEPPSEPSPEQPAMLGFQPRPPSLPPTPSPLGEIPPVVDGNFGATVPLFSMTEAPVSHDAPEPTMPMRFSGSFGFARGTSLPPTEAPEALAEEHPTPREVAPAVPAEPAPAPWQPATPEAWLAPPTEESPEAPDPQFVDSPYAALGNTAPPQPRPAALAAPVSAHADGDDVPIVEVQPEPDSPASVPPPSAPVHSSEGATMFMDVRDLRRIIGEKKAEAEAAAQVATAPAIPVVASEPLPEPAVDDAELIAFAAGDPIVAPSDSGPAPLSAKDSWTERGTDSLRETAPNTPIVAHPPAQLPQAISPQESTIPPPWAIPSKPLAAEEPSIPESDLRTVPSIPILRVPTKEISNQAATWEPPAEAPAWGASVEPDAASTPAAPAMWEPPASPPNWGAPATEPENWGVEAAPAPANAPWSPGPLTAWAAPGPSQWGSPGPSAPTDATHPSAPTPQPGWQPEAPSSIPPPTWLESAAHAREQNDQVAVANNDPPSWFQPIPKGTGAWDAGASPPATAPAPAAAPSTWGTEAAPAWQAAPPDQSAKETPSSWGVVPIGATNDWSQPGPSTPEVTQAPPSVWALNPAPAPAASWGAPAPALDNSPTPQWTPPAKAASAPGWGAPAAPVADAWAPPATPPAAGSDWLVNATGFPLPPPAPPPPDPALTIPGEHRIVLHTLEGSVKRGTATSIDLNSETLLLAPTPGALGELVQLSRAKAVFFLAQPGEKPLGPRERKVKVTFVDGRQIEGFMGADAGRGFFILPLDNKSNTSRVYILNHAVSTVV